MKSYRSELAKYGVDKVNQDLLSAVEVVQSHSQCTAFESHLARVLKKDPSLQAEGITKYVGMFANVPPSDVLPQLWQASQNALKSSGSKSVAPSAGNPAKK